MPRYADPSRCPDCATVLPVAPGRCPTCELPLTGPLAGELLRTLRRADDLVVQLRAGAPTLAPVEVESARVGADSARDPGRVGASARRLDDDRGDRTAHEGRRGIGAPSVPKILLGLGATCLLVAAVIFLAVAWSVIGVGGRTVVLLAATGATGALGVRLGRRGLRVAGESLTAVSLGLLVLDLVGAAGAGWLGTLGGSGLAVLVGVVLAAAGTGFTGLLAALRGDQRRLVVPQLAVVLGAVVAMSAVHDLFDLTTLLLVVEVVVCAGVAHVALGRGVAVLTGGMALVGALWWLALAAYGAVEVVDAAGSVTLRSLWVDGDGTALLAAALLALLPLAVVPGSAAAWHASLAVSGVLLTVTATLATFDNEPTAVAATWLVAVLVWSAVAHLVRRPAAPAALRRGMLAVLAPLALSVIVAGTGLAVFLARALDNVLGVGRVFSEDAGVRLDDVVLDAHPALIVPLTLVLLAAAYVALPVRRLVVLAAAPAVAVAGLATLAQYAVPLWVVVAALVVAGLVVLGLGVLGLVVLADAVRRPRATSTSLVETAAGVALLVAAIVAALPSAGLSAAGLGVLLTVAAGLLALGGPDVVDRTASAVVPLAWGGLVWATTQALDLRVDASALVVIVGGGLLALARPRVESELAATVAALLVAPAAITAALDHSVSLAIHLTVAGALVTATSVVHRDRRLLAIPGGLLLAAATWVRLADLGVHAPEAYTLPLASVLLAVGLDRVRRDAGAPTSVALLPGLVLGTVPSLLWALGDPVSLRALLLGTACLVLVLVGAQVRWSAPVVVGACVGVVLVLWELAPYVVQTPQWVAIGLAGTLLTVVGVTWEKRMHDLQHAGALLGRLR